MCKGGYSIGFGYIHMSKVDKEAVDLFGLRWGLSGGIKKI
jgi:hypothetical protein